MRPAFSITSPSTVVTHSSSLPLGSWTNICATRHPQNGIQLMVNFTISATAAFSNATDFKPLGTVTLGNFRGLIDEIRFWSHTTAAGEAQALMPFPTGYANMMLDNLSLLPSTPNSTLLAYYPFNQNASASCSSSQADCSTMDAISNDFITTTGGSVVTSTEEAPMIALCNPACSSAGGTCVYGVPVCNCYFSYAGSTCTQKMAHSSNTFASGPGVSAFQVTGNAVTFTITAVDISGTSLSVGGSSFNVSLSIATPVSIIDNGNGTYTGSYTLYTSGTYTVSIGIRWTDFFGNTAIYPIMNSPYTVTVSAGTPALSQTTQNLVAGNRTAAPVTQQVLLRDQWLNTNLQGTSTLSTFICSGNCSSSALYTLAFSSPSYIVSLPLTTAGVFTISTFLNGQGIPGMPINITVTPTTALASRCYFTGTYYLDSVPAGTPFVVSAYSFDTYGNARNSPLTDSFTIRATLTPLQIQLSAVPFQLNQYTATFNLTTAGTYVLSGTLVSQSIPASPSTAASVTIIADVVSAPACTFVIDPSPIVTAGTTFGIFLTSRDRYGNQRLVTTDTFSLTSSFINATLTSAAAGFYSINLTPTLAGNFTVSIRIGGNHVSGSPFLLQVQPAAFSPTSALLYGPGLSGGRAGDVLQLFVQARDAYSNNCVFPPGTVLQTTVFPTPALSITSLSSDSQIYSLNLTFTAVSLPTLLIRFNNVSMSSVATQLNVTFGAIYAPNCIMSSGTGRTSHVATVNGTFSVDIYDAYNNRILQAGVRLAIRVALQPALIVLAPAQIIDSNTLGTYNITYGNAGAGFYQVSLTSLDFTQHVQGSPFVVEIVGPASLASIVPTTGPSSGSVATLTGSNFLAAGGCRVNGTAATFVYISATQARCILPTVPGGSTVLITVSNDGLLFSSPQTFRFYANEVITAVDPVSAQSWGGDPVTVTGSNFINSTSLACFFGTSTTPAIVDFSGHVVCLTPPASAGIVAFGVTNNGLVYTSSRTFTFTEAFSPLCRETGELSIGVSERTSLGIPYFPNLALNSNTSLSTPGSRDGVLKSDIADGDRCCAFTAQSLGYKCGLEFAQTTNGFVQAVVSLAKPAFINEFVTAWYLPCRNQPNPSFSFDLWDETTSSWSPILTRFTKAVGAEITRPCFTIPSDKSDASLCLDFLTEAVVGTTFRVTFNNSVSNLGASPALTDGGWLYELEAHGIYVDDPYHVGIWLDTSSFAAVQRTNISGVNIQILNYAWNSIPVDSVSRNISLRLFIGQGSVPDDFSPTSDVTSLLGGPRVVSSASAAAQTITGLYLTAPLAGPYTLCVTSPGLAPDCSSFDIVTGPPALLQLSVQQITVAAALHSSIPVLLTSVDAGNNPIAADVSRTITATANPATYGGSDTQQMVDGSASFTALELQSPRVGSYSIVFRTPGLADATLLVTVTLGAPYRYWSSTTAVQVSGELNAVVPSLTISVLDAGDNFLGAADAGIPVSVSESQGTLVLAGQLSSTTVQGSTTFSNTQVLGPAVGVYTLVYGAQNELQVHTVALTVVPGQPYKLVAPQILSIVCESISTIPDLIISVVDAANNPVTLSGVSVTIQSPDLLSNQTQTLNNGVAVFSGLQTAAPTMGTLSIFASAPGLVGTAPQVEVYPGAPNALRLDWTPGPPAQSMADTHVATVWVGIFDVGENILPAETATLSFSSSGPIVTSSGTDAFSIIDISLESPPAGDIEIFITASGFNTLSLTVTVIPGPPVGLAIVSATSFSSQSSLNFAINTVSVSGIDAGGTIVPLTGAVQASCALGFTLASVTSVAAVGGIANFTSLALASPPVGSYVIDFTSGPLRVINPLQINVLTGAATNLFISTPVGSPVVIAGSNSFLPFVLVTKDAGAYITPLPPAVVDPVVVVTLLPPAGYTAPAPLTILLNNSAGWTGSASSSYSLIKPLVGNYTLVFSSAVMAPTSIRFSVAAGPAARLGSSVGNMTISASITAAVPTFQLRSYDAAGNLLGSPDPLSVLVTASVSNDLLAPQPSSGATALLSGGLATFANLALLGPTSGIYTITFSASSFLAMPSISLTVTPGLPASMSFVTAPPAVYTNRIAMTVAIAVFDIVGNQVTSAVAIQAESQPVVVLQGSTATTVAGLATFNSLAFTGVYGLNYTLSFSVPGLPLISSVVFIPACATLYPLTVPDGAGTACLCPSGYQPDTTVSNLVCLPCRRNFFKTDSGNGACVSCPSNKETLVSGATSPLECSCVVGYYSVDRESECLVCPLGGDCPGDTVLRASPGWWREPGTDSSTFYQCDLRAACTNSTCAEGYTGPKCAVCADGYGKFGNACQICPPSTTNYGLVVLLMLGIIAALVVLVKTATGPKSTASMTGKILVNYFHQISFLASFAVPWPATVTAVYNYISISTLSSSILSVSCAFRMNFYQYFQLYLALPFVGLGAVFLVFGAYWLFFRLFRRTQPVEEINKFKADLKDQVLVSALVIVFLSHPTITRQVLQVFNCTDKIGSYSYLVEDLTLKCNTPTHNIWRAVGVFMLLFYSVGIPVGGILLLYKYRFRLQEPAVASKLRFLFDGYADKRYYWEMIIMLRKLLLVLFVVFLRSMPLVQICCGLIVMNASLLMQKLFQPHKLPLHKNLEFTALSVVYVLMLIGLLFIGDELSLSARTFLMICAVVANVIMFTICAVVIAFGFFANDYVKNSIVGKKIQALLSPPEKLKRQPSLRWWEAHSTVHQEKPKTAEMAVLARETPAVGLHD
eukprot:TRINITY_DN974_c0_g1_i1.p1 TRINITY_DN974_c0_g1~~TRINITY_DN974_c0_g1_i1.p1  ORF type:complete len:2810 (-),score=593.72 TRINITY_DN974_c0_g1_i1:44-8227(-)